MSLKKRLNEEVEDPKNPLDIIRESVWGKVAGVVLAVIIAFFLLGLDPCLSGTLIPAVIFGLPLFFGMRKLKDLLIVGTVIFVVMCLFLPTFQIISYEPSQTGQSSGELLFNLSASGDALPAGEDVSFTVLVKNVNNYSVNLTGVEIKITHHKSLFIPFDTPTPGTYNMTEISNDGNVSWYEHTANLGAGLYSYEVFAHYGNNTANLSSNRYDGVMVYETVPYILVSALFYFILYASLFYILVGITWWLRRMKKMREGDMPTARTMPKGEFTCSDCGGEVMASEKSCPHCGADFDDD
ncbi:MAG TPA: hypothetical protein ENN76_02015 [Euryarchaeota archaeon]|nr:hypothetical protein [Euryarchaeota archaeon]